MKVVDIRTTNAADNAAIAARLREAAARIEDGAPPVTAFALAVSFGDGSIGTEYGGGDFVRLLGAVGVLRARIEGEFE